jgi:DNA polymerase-3 subunit gamma/tau
MYQALYRKYRPKNLDEVVGQKVITTTLVNEIKNKKISHAYLFAGPRGTGKTSVAKIFASLINCKDLKDMKVCGKCVPCTQKNNSDILEIDAASNNGVDEIRELKSKINLVPSYCDYKVYIIDEVHMLSTGAFNALLKTLEEPPVHAIFILATTDPHKIPETILSRCQRFDFKKISEKGIIQKLLEISKKEKINISEPTIREIAKLSDGGLRDAIGLLDQLTAYCDDIITLEDVHEVNGTISKQELIIFSEALLESNLKTMFDFINKHSENGKDMIKLAEEILIYFRDLLFDNLNLKIDYNVENKGKISNEKLIKIINYFNQEIKIIKSSNNPKIAFELLCIKTLDKVGNIEKENKIIELKEKEDKKSNTKTISQEIKSEAKVKVDLGNNNELENLKKRRINNTLSGFNKKELISIKKTIKTIDVNDYEIKDLKIISLINDGDLRAAGNKYLIFVYKKESMAEIFNKNIIFIENIVEEELKEDYRVIAVTLDEWQIIKEEFNSKQTKYVFEKEGDEIYNFLSNAENTVNDELSTLFGQIVETK